MDALWLLLGIVSLIVIYFVVYGFSKPGMNNHKRKSRHDSRHTEDTKQAMKRIMSLFKTKDRIHNNDVEELLEVSDSTATRYLDRLEEAGKIEQVGAEGRGVYYRKRKEF